MDIDDGTGAETIITRPSAHKQAQRYGAPPQEGNVEGDHNDYRVVESYDHLQISIQAHEDPRNQSCWAPSVHLASARVSQPPLKLLQQGWRDETWLEAGNLIISRTSYTYEARPCAERYLSR